MPTDIYREFDPNLDIPADLKNVIVLSPDKDDDDTVAPVYQDDGVTDPVDQPENPDDTGGGEGDGTVDNTLLPPSYFSVVSRTYYTAPDGTKVVDIVIDVEDVDGAVDYEVRLSR
jgi:hypothetical protein